MSVRFLGQAPLGPGGGGPGVPPPEQRLGKEMCGYVRQKCHRGTYADRAKPFPFETLHTVRCVQTLGTLCTEQCGNCARGTGPGQRQHENPKANMIFASGQTFKQ